MAEVKEITTRNVLLECLEYEKQLWRNVSKRYNTLEPAPGLDEEWETQRRKCEILQELIQSMESEAVRKAIAGWQLEIMRSPEEARARAMGFAEGITK